MPVNLMSYPSYPKNALLRAAKVYPLETFCAVLATVVTLFLCCRLTLALTPHQPPLQPACGLISGRFSYNFSESTGPNQAILLAGQEKDIDFDRVRSNPMALHSLDALRWNVLYPNAHGGKITLVGTYDSATGNFILQDWHLRTPFQRVIVADENEPGEQKIVIAPHLRRDDFGASPEFDPNSAPFNPRLHEIAK